MSYTLYAAKGCGSAIVELALLKLNQPYRIEWVEWGKFADSPLAKVNPLLQVPTLQAGDQILSESLGICTWLNTRHSGHLIPDAQDPLFAAYQRWSVFLVASIYPTFFYGDHPERWVKHQESQNELRKETNRIREEMWLQVEAAARGPQFFLGEKESLIDSYIAVMVHWRPRRAWFTRNAPKLEAIATHIAKDQKLAPVFDQFKG